MKDAAIDVTFWRPIRWTFHEAIYRSSVGEGQPKPQEYESSMGSPFVMAAMRCETEPDLTEVFQNALAVLQHHFGRIDPKWGDVNRLDRGDKSWALSGAPDVLRAIYGVFDEDAGHQEATAGDSYIMFVEWSPDGDLSSHTIHNFGSVTLDATSSHYDDQAPIFASEKERRLPLDMVTLMAEKTSDKRIAGGL